MGVKEVPFKFGLERVRGVRVHAEDRAREALAASLNERSRGAAMLAAAAELVERARDERRDGASAELSGQDLLAQQLWLERVERHRQDAELEHDRRDADLQASRQALSLASQRREALDRLKQRRAEEHARSEARRAGAFLDEIALSNHVRRAAGR